MKCRLAARRGKIVMGGPNPPQATVNALAEHFQSEAIPPVIRARDLNKDSAQLRVRSHDSPK
jgi:hypothetical protein